MKKFLKALAVVLCAAILVAGSVTATIAYLATKTNPVQSTFVAGDITIGLSTSNASSNTMIPGTVIDFDSTVTVESGSVECWLFIKVTEENDFADYMTYTVNTGAIENPDWEALDGETGVYYRHVAATSEDTSFSFEGSVTVDPNLTKAQSNAIAEPLPQLSFTAYAVQYANFDLGTTDHDVAAAWAIAKALENPSANS